MEPGLKDTLANYAALMEEVKVRLKFAQATISDAVGTPPQLLRETATLQIRLVCELIALACLTAHSDLTAKKSSLRKAYAADEILNALLALNPAFFPKPHVRSATGPGAWHLADKPPPFSTRDDLVALCRKCGEGLHRGSLKKLMKPGSISVQKTYPDIEGTIFSIIQLLEHHSIRLANGNYILCLLENSYDGNRVQVLYAEAATESRVVP